MRAAELADVLRSGVAFAGAGAAAAGAAGLASVLATLK
jgi:hypothetical protein